jgi:cytochrome c5
VATGSAINAAPVSYALDDTQYVLIPIGAGGGAQFVYPELHAGANAHGPTRLLAFTLEGDRDMPRSPADERVLPSLRSTASPETIEHGKALYAEKCGFCHGKDASARAGGSVPDLRFASEETHASWNSIVIGGARRANGMPAVPLSAADAEAIRQYAIHALNRLRTRQQP